MTFIVSLSPGLMLLPFHDSSHTSLLPQPCQYHCFSPRPFLVCLMPSTLGQICWLDRGHMSAVLPPLGILFLSCPYTLPFLLILFFLCSLHHIWFWNLYSCCSLCTEPRHPSCSIPVFQTPSFLYFFYHFLFFLCCLPLCITSSLSFPT